MTIPSYEHDPIATQSLAQEAIAFAFTEDGLTAEDKSGVAVVILQHTIEELRSLPSESSIAWSQGYWRQSPSKFVCGIAEKDYSDGSRLHITIHDAVDPLNLANSFDPISISLRTSHPTDQSKAVRVSYRVEKSGSAVLQDIDKGFGMNIVGAMTLADKLEELDPLEEADYEEMLGGIMLESSIMAEGLSPDFDADIEEFRDSSEAYKLVSDTARAEILGNQLEAQLGFNTERPLSLGGTLHLVSFLQGL